MTTTLRFFAAACFSLAAGVHAALVGVHFDEAIATGALFIFAAGFQLATATLVLRGARGRLLAILAGGNALIVAGWALSRTTGLPQLGIAREPIMTHDLVTATLETLGVATLVYLAMAARDRSVSLDRWVGGIAALALTGVVLAGPAAVAHEEHGKDHAISAAGHGSTTAASAHAHGLRRPGESDPGPANRPPASGTAVEAGEQPVAITSRESIVWVASREDGLLTRIDAETAQTRTGVIGGRPTGIASANGLLWVSDYRRDVVLTFDPETLERVGSPIDVDPGPLAIAAAGDDIFVTTGQEGTLHRIDARSRTIERTVPVGFGPSSMSIGSGTIWITLALERGVVPVDADTMRVGRRIETGAGASSVLVAHDRVWVSNASDGTVSVLDPEQRTIVATLKVDDRSLPGLGPTALVAADGLVWVANNHDKTIRPIDADTQEVGSLTTFTERLGTTPVASQMTAVGDDLWVTDADEGVAVRLHTEGAHHA